MLWVVPEALDNLVQMIRIAGKRLVVRDIVAEVNVYHIRGKGVQIRDVQIARYTSNAMAVL